MANLEFAVLCEDTVKHFDGTVTICRTWNHRTMIYEGEPLTGCLFCRLRFGPDETGRYTVSVRFCNADGRRLSKETELARDVDANVKALGPSRRKDLQFDLASIRILHVGEFQADIFVGKEHLGSVPFTIGQSVVLGVSDDLEPDD